MSAIRTPESFDRCTRCGEVLGDTEVVWLELDIRTSRYGALGTVPDRHSQGGFPFGSACAQHVLDHGGKLQRIRRAAR